jgi:hypothetical protein
MFENPPAKARRREGKSERVDRIAGWTRFTGGGRGKVLSHGGTKTQREKTE